MTSSWLLVTLLAATSSVTVGINYQASITYASPTCEGKPIAFKFVLKNDCVTYNAPTICAAAVKTDCATDPIAYVLSVTSATDQYFFKQLFVDLCVTPADEPVYAFLLDQCIPKATSAYTAFSQFSISNDKIVETSWPSDATNCNGNPESTKRFAASSVTGECVPADNAKYFLTKPRHHLASGEQYKLSYRYDSFSCGGPLQAIVASVVASGTTCTDIPSCTAVAGQAGTYETVTCGNTIGVTDLASFFPVAFMHRSYVVRASYPSDLCADPITEITAFAADLSCVPDGSGSAAFSVDSSLGLNVTAFTTTDCSSTGISTLYTGAQVNSNLCLNKSVYSTSFASRYKATIIFENAVGCGGKALSIGFHPESTCISEHLSACSMGVKTDCTTDPIAYIRDKFPSSNYFIEHSFVDNKCATEVSTLPFLALVTDAGFSGSCVAAGLASGNAIKITRNATSGAPILAKFASNGACTSADATNPSLNSIPLDIINTEACVTSDNAKYYYFAPKYSLATNKQYKIMWQYSSDGCSGLPRAVSASIVDSANCSAEQSCARASGTSSSYVRFVCSTVANLDELFYLIYGEAKISYVVQHTYDDGLCRGTPSIISAFAADGACVEQILGGSTVQSVTASVSATGALVISTFSSSTCDGLPTKTETFSGRQVNNGLCVTSCKSLFWTFVQMHYLAVIEYEADNCAGRALHVAFKPKESCKSNGGACQLNRVLSSCTSDPIAFLQTTFPNNEYLVKAGFSEPTCSVLNSNIAMLALLVDGGVCLQGVVSGNLDAAVAVTRDANYVPTITTFPGSSSCSAADATKTGKPVALDNLNSDECVAIDQAKYYYVTPKYTPANSYQYQIVWQYSSDDCSGVPRAIWANPVAVGACQANGVCTKDPSSVSYLRTLCMGTANNVDIHQLFDRSFGPSTSYGIRHMYTNGLCSGQPAAIVAFAADGRCVEKTEGSTIIVSFQALVSPNGDLHFHHFAASSDCEGPASSSNHFTNGLQVNAGLCVTGSRSKFWSFFKTRYATTIRYETPDCGSKPLSIVFVSDQTCLLDSFSACDQGQRIGCTNDIWTYVAQLGAGHRFMFKIPYQDSTWCSQLDLDTPIVALLADGANCLLQTEDYPTTMITISQAGSLVEATFAATDTKCSKVVTQTTVPLSAINTAVCSNGFEYYVQTPSAGPQKGQRYAVSVQFSDSLCATTPRALSATLVKAGEKCTPVKRCTAVKRPGSNAVTGVFTKVECTTPLESEDLKAFFSSRFDEMGGGSFAVRTTFAGSLCQGTPTSITAFAADGMCSQDLSDYSSLKVTVGMDGAIVWNHYVSSSTCEEDAVTQLDLGAFRVNLDYCVQGSLFHTQFVPKYSVTKLYNTDDCEDKMLLAVFDWNPACDAQQPTDCALGVIVDCTVDPFKYLAEYALTLPYGITEYFADGSWCSPNLQDENHKFVARIGDGTTCAPRMVLYPQYKATRLTIRTNADPLAITYVGNDCSSSQASSEVWPNYLLNHQDFCINNRNLYTFTPSYKLQHSDTVTIVLQYDAPGCVGTPRVTTATITGSCQAASCVEIMDGNVHTQLYTKIVCGGTFQYNFLHSVLQLINDPGMSWGVQTAFNDENCQGIPDHVRVFAADSKCINLYADPWGASIQASVDPATKELQLISYTRANCVGDATSASQRGLNVNHGMCVDNLIWETIHVKTEGFAVRVGYRDSQCQGDIVGVWASLVEDCKTPVENTCVRADNHHDVWVSMTCVNGMDAVVDYVANQALENIGFVLHSDYASTTNCDDADLANLFFYPVEEQQYFCAVNLKTMIGVTNAYAVGQGKVTMSIHGGLSCSLPSVETRSYPVAPLASCQGLLQGRAEYTPLLTQYMVKVYCLDIACANPVSYIANAAKVLCDLVTATAPVFDVKTGLYVKSICSDQPALLAVDLFPTDSFVVAIGNNEFDCSSRDGKVSGFLANTEYCAVADDSIMLSVTVTSAGLITMTEYDADCAIPDNTTTKTFTNPTTTDVCLKDIACELASFVIQVQIRSKGAVNQPQQCLIDGLHVYGHWVGPKASPKTPPPTAPTPTPTTTSTTPAPTGSTPATTTTTSTKSLSEILRFSGFCLAWWWGLVLAITA